MENPTAFVVNEKLFHVAVRLHMVFFSFDYILRYIILYACCLHINYLIIENEVVTRKSQTEA